MKKRHSPALTFSISCSWSGSHSKRNLVVGRSRRRAGLFHRAIDLLLRSLEQSFAFGRKRFAFFEELHGAVELDAAVLELFDDRFEPRNLLLEGTRCLIRHQPLVRAAPVDFRARIPGSREQPRPRPPARKEYGSCKGRPYASAGALAWHGGEDFGDYPACFMAFGADPEGNQFILHKRKE